MTTLYSTHCIHIEKHKSCINIYKNWSFTWNWSLLNKSMLLLHMLNIILSQKIIPNNEIEASHVVAFLTSLWFHASKFQAPPEIYTKLTKKNNNICWAVKWKENWHHDSCISKHIIVSQESKVLIEHSLICFLLSLKHFKTSNKMPN